MAYAVEAPARDDLPLRTNNDTVAAYRWTSSGVGVPITSAVVAFEFDPPPTVYDADTGLPLPPPPAEVHTITSTTPGDPDGWIEGARFADGYLIVHVAHTIWAAYDGSRGVWDGVAVAVDPTVGWRCLVRGRFTVETGVAS